MVLHYSNLLKANIPLMKIGLKMNVFERVKVEDNHTPTFETKRNFFHFNLTFES